MHGEVKVNRIVEEVFPDATGKLARMLRVEFMVGAHGPFTERFPAESSNAAQIRMKLDEVARTINSIAG
jgi:hypothetical protein